MGCPRAGCAAVEAGEARAVIQDIASYEEMQELLAVLKLVALGRRDSENGDAALIEDVVERVLAGRYRRSCRGRNSIGERHCT